MSVELEEVGGFLVVALAEEIGFADGGVGEREFDGRSGE